MGTETLLIWLRNGLKFRLIAETLPEIKLLAEIQQPHAGRHRSRIKFQPRKGMLPESGAIFGVFFRTNP